MKVIDVPANTKVFLGAPAEPFPQELIASIARGIYAIEGIEELHLPQCFALGIMKSPSPLLVLVTGPNLSTARAARKAKRALKGLLPSGLNLDVWPLRFDSPYVQAVQQVNCGLERELLTMTPYRKPNLFWRLIGVC
jgi:hypothetical protein